MKKVNTNKVFSKRNKSFYGFSPNEEIIRKYTSKTLEYLYFGTSHYLVNTVVLFPNSFNSYNDECFKLKRNKLAAAEHLSYEFF